MSWLAVVILLGLSPCFNLLAMKYSGELIMAGNERELYTSLIHPSHHIAYFASATDPARVIRIDLETFERIDSLLVGPNDGDITSGVISPDGDHAYFTLWDIDLPGALIKIDLNTFERTASLELPSNTVKFRPISLIKDNQTAYFVSTDSEQPAVSTFVEVDLQEMEVTRSLQFDTLFTEIESAVIDSTASRAFLGTDRDPAEIIEIDLVSMSVSGSLSEPDMQGPLAAAGICSGDGHAYFARTDTEGIIYKISLSPLALEEQIVLPQGEGRFLTNIAMDCNNQNAYFAPASSGSISIIDLSTFEHAGNLTGPNPGFYQSALIDPAREMGLFTKDAHGLIERYSLGEGEFVDDLEMPPDEGGIESILSSSETGYIYASASKWKSSIVVGRGILEINPHDLSVQRSLWWEHHPVLAGTISPDQENALYLLAHNAPRLIKVSIGAMEIKGELDFPFTVHDRHAIAMDPGGEFVYVALSLDAPEILKVSLDSMTVVDSISASLVNIFQASVSDLSGHHVYFAGQGISADATFYKLDTASFEIEDSFELQGNFSMMQDAAISPGGDYGYFLYHATNQDPRLVRLDLNTMQSTGMTEIEIEGNQVADVVINADGSTAYITPLSNSRNEIISVDLSSMEQLDSLYLEPHHTGLRAAVLDASQQSAILGTNGLPGAIVRVDVESVFSDGFER